MADSMSSDTNSEYHEDNLSDTSAERQSRFVIVGQKPNFDTSKNERNILQKLFTREIRGCLSKHKNAPQEKLFPTIPEWGHLPLLHIIPMSALQAGHIVMGMTQCGKFILTYTCSLDLRGNESAYKYSLHWWAFSPHRISKKVAEITLFGSYCISKELDVVVAQWPMETNKVVIHGLQSDWGNSQTTDKAYLTITKVPSLSNCRDCAKVAASYEEDELAANWDGCVQFNCLIHGLTVHTTYEVISPYPRFRASVCLKYWNHIVINTGNFLHVLRVDLIIPKINKNSNDNGSEDLINNKLINNDNIEQIIQVDVNDIYELDCYEINRKISTPESINGDELSPVRDNTSSTLLCECYNNGDCDYCIKNNSLSVRDKILQDFCDDMTQELSIGSDSITLVKHPSCSPRSTPQRLPADLKQQWSININTPPSDILRTRTSTSTTNEKSSLVNGRFNSNSKRSLSPQPGTSQEPTTIVSINSPLNTLSISPSPCSPRLMSPPITTSFRQRSLRKNSSSSSSSSSSAVPPPPTSTTTTTTRTRSSHKLILEAEKAYEFTDDSLEPGEKLSSFRKRRLADKKYEFKVEAEDTENIIPFKHIRDQNEQRYCPIHRLNSVDITPAYSSNNTKWHCHRPDSENSESEDTSSQDVFNGCFKPVEPAEKSVLRPLSQNQLYSFFSSRDRYGKITHNDSPLAPKAFIPYPSIKCTAHFKRSFIELDDEMVSVITDVEGMLAIFNIILLLNLQLIIYLFIFDVK
ncbi:uncharacterized protein LOC122859134 [Aphidius gifuensis]|uniref:uncharacterized protein LOC122859134 n=1 Tax=Aphidius gifuensis TaxID=684658 RepID=UPI001CDCA2C0|nr:uncharacterized protein LOC122859134 [Aphidius gifuensis]